MLNILIYLSDSAHYSSSYEQFIAIFNMAEPLYNMANRLMVSITRINNLNLFIFETTFNQ